MPARDRLPNNPTPPDQTMTSKEESRSEIATDSHRYGNEKTIEDAFNNPFSPQPGELYYELVGTSHLTEKEAFAFTQGHFGRMRGVSDERLGDELVQEWGFESYAEFRTIEETAEKKVADAIWIYELIDTFRSALPDECSNCGDTIEGDQFEVGEDEAIALCVACADDESGKDHIEKQRIAVLGEVEDLLEDVESKTGERPGRILQNINIAREKLWDDGEFDHCVRLALLQLEQVAEKSEDGAAELREEIIALREQLSEKAAFPPQDQLTR